LGLGFVGLGFRFWIWFRVLGNVTRILH